MARSTNMAATRIKPEAAQLVTVHVLRREQVSPSFVRVTLGGGDIADFDFMGFDQWFRLFLPVSEGSLSRLPKRLDTFAYLRFLAIAKTERPVLRNYTVRAFRESGADGPELDIDFVIHGSPAQGTSGPAATWAQTCREGDAVAILDEGIAYHPPVGLERNVLLVSDETGLPAVAGILAAMPRDAAGTVIIEIGDPDDVQNLGRPAAVDVRWIVREDPHAVPGRAALAAALALDPPAQPVYAWAVGEQALPTSLRRHWIAAGIPKEHISFCGYWRHTGHR